MLQPLTKRIMRIQLQLSPNYQPVPFNHLHQLTGALHKWLGPNTLHDGLSLYSFGWLRGGEKIGNGLMFPQGAHWAISFFDIQSAKDVMQGILDDPNLAFGMKVTAIQLKEFPEPSQKSRFWADSPIVVRKKRPDGSREYLDWRDKNADIALTQILRRKIQLAKISVNADEISVKFDRDYPRASTKLMEIKGTRHKGNLCPVFVEGPPEIGRFAWLVGVGELTGSGFGALK